MDDAQLTAPAFAHSPGIQRQSSGISEIKEPFLKRPFDMCLAGLGLLFSAPLWGTAALAIKLEDGGPVFFQQERWGKGGLPIQVYKFRTMVPNANPTGVTVQATKDDPRITRVGKILRATAFDEIPQLLNNGSEALVIGYPGHALRVYGWMEPAHLRVFVLTDGSGGRLAPDSTQHLIAKASARRRHRETRYQLYPKPSRPPPTIIAFLAFPPVFPLALMIPL